MRELWVEHGVYHRHVIISASAALPDTADVLQRLLRNQDEIGEASQGHDSTQLNQAIAALRANGDSIATFLSQANPRGFARETLRGALQMHINLVLKQVTAHLNKDWSGSVAAFDESQRQGLQMADMLSEGIMKQFPSRFVVRSIA